MATSGSDTSGHGTRANQEETSPFPLELMLAAARAAQNQDETAPFPLGFEVIARRARQSQDETAPFLLEFRVMSPDGEIALVPTTPVEPSRAAHSQSTRSQSAHLQSLPSRAASSKTTVSRLAAEPQGFAALPDLKWRGIDASDELREYAARVASGEELPPFRGPILAGSEVPRTVREPVPSGEMASDSKAFLKLALAAIVMSAALFAAAVLGDDAELRAAGETIGSWLRGPERVISTFPLVEPAQSHANVPCETAQPLP
jgi:hypothetical protein